MRESFRKIPWIKSFPSKANFFLCQMLDSSMHDRFWQTMLREGVYLREVNDFLDLDKSYFRLAIKTRESNCVFLKLIQEVSHYTRNYYDSDIHSVSS